MTKTEELDTRRRSAVARGVAMFAGDVAVESASGARLVDVDGQEWIDLAGGIGTVNAGHCQPDVVRAVVDQAAALMHTCIHVATYEPYVALCERLNALLPHGGPTKTMLVNSGAEAVENAVKIARQATGRPAVVCFSEAFHGRTMMAMTLTSKTGYTTGCGPFSPEVYRLDFPNYFRYGDGLRMDEFVDRELQRMRDLFSVRVSADDVAAIVLEVVQGEGGFVPVPGSYLKGLRRICDERGIVLVFDEVQSGFCRTGRWAAYEHFGVTPDVSTYGKSLGSGLPIAAVVGRASVMDAARPGTIGGTYGGNPVACAAALATIDLMERLDLNARALAIGQRVRDRFAELQKRTDVIADVRGLGAMVGAEFCYSGDPARPAGPLVADVLAQCRERRVLALSAGVYGNVIRMSSPLVISDEDLDYALDVIEQAVLASCAGGPSRENDGLVHSEGPRR